MPDSPQDRAAGGRDSWTRRRRTPSWCRSRTRDSSRGSRPSSLGRATPAVERQVGELLRLGRRGLRALGRPPRVEAHPARLPPGRHGLRREFLGIRWPDDAMRLFTVSVADVQAFRDRDARRRPGAQDDQPPHRLALQLLQVPPGGRLGVPPADHRPQPGARPVHPPRLLRPARRDQGPLRHPGPPAHGHARRRLRSSTTATARSSSSSSTAGSGSAPAAGSR